MKTKPGTLDHYRLKLHTGLRVFRAAGIHIPVQEWDKSDPANPRIVRRDARTGRRIDLDPEEFADPYPHLNTPHCTVCGRLYSEERPRMLLKEWYKIRYTDQTSQVRGIYDFAVNRLADHAVTRFMKKIPRVLCRSCIMDCFRGQCLVTVENRRSDQ